VASAYVPTEHVDGIQVDEPVTVQTDPLAPDSFCLAVGSVTVCLAPDEQEQVRAALA
jgi:hypothetical protein